MAMSYDNAVALQKIGYNAALYIAQVLKERPDRATLESQLASYRYAGGLLEAHPRPRQLLRGIFQPLFSDFERFTTRINTEHRGHEPGRGMVTR